ncbi:uncharacterized protein ACUXNS_002304 [Brevibacterium pityocampae]
MSDPVIEVTDNPAEHRYDITVDGAPAGFSAYRDTTAPRGGGSGSGEGDAPGGGSSDPAQQRILYHTVIDEAFSGRGLASRLTRDAIAASVTEGYRVVPLCPYVKSWVGKHDEFADHVDPVSSAHLALFS